MGWVILLKVEMRMINMCSKRFQSKKTSLTFWQTIGPKKSDADSYANDSDISKQLISPKRLRGGLASDSWFTGQKSSSSRSIFYPTKV